MFVFVVVCLTSLKEDQSLAVLMADVRASGKAKSRQTLNLEELSVSFSDPVYSAVK